MKLFVSCLLAASAVSMVAGGDREYHKLKKWAFMKAMEGCLGQEAVKQYMVKVKTSAAKCMKVDAPELDLPMFQAPYRVVGALLDGAFNGENPHTHTHSHYPNRPGHTHGGGDNDWIDRVMKKVFVQKMMEMFLEDEFDGSEDGDGDAMMDGLASLGGPRPRRKHFKANYNAMRRNQQGRWKRQSDSEAASSVGDSANASKKQMFELGDRLNAKLQQAKERMEDKIGNYTCMLRECGVVDASNNLASVEQLKEEMGKFAIRDQWLRDNLDRDIELCHAFAESVPQEVLEDCSYGPQLAKVKMYKKCLKMHKLRTCVNYDVKQQLEANFGGSLEDLVETTQMDEEELLPLVMTLLQGPEVEY